jgi:hypothetical protein
MSAGSCARIASWQQHSRSITARAPRTNPQDSFPRLHTRVCKLRIRRIRRINRRHRRRHLRMQPIPAALAQHMAVTVKARRYRSRLRKRQSAVAPRHLRWWHPHRVSHIGVTTEVIHGVRILHRRTRIHRASMVFGGTTELTSPKTLQILPHASVTRRISQEILGMAPRRHARPLEATVLRLVRDPVMDSPPTPDMAVTEVRHAVVQMDPEIESRVLRSLVWSSRTAKRSSGRILSLRRKVLFLCRIWRLPRYPCDLLIVTTIWRSSYSTSYAT